MGNLHRSLALLILLVLAGCASTHQANQQTPEQRHRAAVYNMLVTSPLPDLLLGGIEKGFNKAGTTAQQQALYDCAVGKLSRPAIANAYTDPAMPLFTEQQADELTRQMKSELGKRGNAHFIAVNLKRDNPLKPLTKEEQQQYSIQTLAFWLKVQVLMKDEGAKADLKVLLVQSLTACKP